MQITTMTKELVAHNAFITIVARNYFALARVCIESIQHTHPEAATYVLVVDAVGFSPEYQIPGVTLVSPYEILDVLTFEAMAYSYGVTELSTSLKPFALAYLLMLGHQNVVYLDPDIAVFFPLEEVFDAMMTSNIALVPHITEPIPFDGHLPDEFTLIQAGTYNLGFIAVANTAESRRFLTWWGERLKTMSVVDVDAGLFTDQKWVNLVPGSFEGVTILRSRGLDIAYWNLHERTVDPRNPKQLTTGESIIFFHFSGFDPRNPGRLSRYQDRFEPADEPGLAALLAMYAKRVVRAGYEHFRKIEYGFARFSNGVSADVFSRHAIRNAFAGGVELIRPGIATSGSVFEWLNSPVTGSAADDPPFVTNYLNSLYELRSDLHATIGDPRCAGRERFFGWLELDQHHGAGQRFMLAARGGEKTTRATHAAGVNAIGYFKAESGMGENGRSHIVALRKLGVAVNLLDVSFTTASRLDDDSLDAATKPLVGGAINLVMVNADQVPNVRRIIGEHYFKDRYNIGCWSWELPTFPRAWHDRFQYFDEIWVASDFIRDALVKHSPVPVVRIPLPLTIPALTRPDRSRFDLADDEYVFLYVFDFLSFFERKNPLATIKAFRRAFRAGERVRLVLKFSNSDTDSKNRKRLYHEAGRDLRIKLLDGYLDRADKNSLFASCDAYVSLHRAEGFGITIAEAMSLGKPVIATNWSGNVDFMNDQNSFPVDYRLCVLGSNVGPYEHGQVWADPSIEHAAEMMRTVYDRRDEAQRRASRAVRDIQSSLSADAVSGSIAVRLQHAVDALTCATIAREPAKGFRK